MIKMLFNDLSIDIRAKIYEHYAPKVTSGEYETIVGGFMKEYGSGTFENTHSYTGIGISFTEEQYTWMLLRWS